MMIHANSGGQYTLAPIRLSQVSLQDLDQLIRRHLLVPKNFPQNCVSFAYGNGITNLVGMFRSWLRQHACFDHLSAITDGHWLQATASATGSGYDLQRVVGYP
jgi:hypothetical protein